MMNPSDTAEELNYMPPPTGPGSRLMAARNSRGLSIEDVANRMHLSTSIIVSIEEDDFDAITAPIFVKGYLRAYARIVMLNEDEMIAQYVEGYSDHDPTINTTSSMAAEITVDDARIKWTTYLVIFVLIALLGIWWWNKNQNKADVFSLDALQTDTQAQSDTSDDAMQEEIEAVSESVASIQIEAPVTEVAPEEEVVSEISKIEEATEELVQQEPIDEIEAGEETKQEVVEETSQSTAVIRMSPIGSDHLVIIVHADTWADIKDSGDHQLVYDLLRAGQEVKMTGQAPFAVFLGNGHGAELIYNDESVDMSNRIRDDNTARLRLGN